jgi:hypothetical protein
LRLAVAAVEAAANQPQVAAAAAAAAAAANMLKAQAKALVEDLHC